MLSTRFMPLAERLQRLVEGIDAPVAAFTRDGTLVGSSNAARSLPGLRDLSEAGLDEARDAALKHGHAERQISAGHVTLQRVGRGADVGLIALFETGAAAAHFSPPRRGEGSGVGVHEHSACGPHPPSPAGGEGEEAPAMPGEAPTEFTLIDLVDEFAEETAEPVAAAPDYEAPASSGEAPAEFALVDEFADEPVQALPEPAIEDAAAEAVSEEAIAETIEERQRL